MMVILSKRRRAWLIATVAAMLATFTLPNHAAAATRTWSGLAWPDTNMSNGANWIGGVAPGAGDDLVFPAAAAHSNVTPNLAVNFNSLSFDSAPGNTYAVQSGTITVVGYMQVGSGEADLFANVVLYSNGSATNITLSAGTGAELVILGSVIGPSQATLHIAGHGRTTLSGHGFYTGATMVDNGTLRIQMFDALGSAAAGQVYVNPGATLELAALTGPIDKPLNLTNGSTLLASESDTLSGFIGLLDQFPSINVAANKQLTITGVVFGDGSFSKDGPGDLLFKGAQDNTFGQIAGAAVINTGTMHLLQFGGGVDHVALPFGMTVNNGATVTYEANEQVDRLVTVNSGGRIQMQTFHDAYMWLGGPVGGTVDIAGGGLDVADGQFAGALTGTGTFKAVGGTDVQLTGTSTFTGTSYVINQKLLVRGTLPGPVVLQGGTLQGIGTTGTVTNLGNAAVVPGIMGGGTLHTQNFTLTKGAFFLQAWQNPGGPAWSQVRAIGTVTLGDGSATGVTLVPQFDPSITTLPATPIVIIDNDGTDPVVGTFTGRPEGSFFISNGLTCYISYHGGDGNDVTLTASPVQQTLKYYLSEGSTGGFFSTDILIANPNGADASVTMTFYTQSNGVVTQTLTVPAMTRKTITLNSIAAIGDGAVSTIVDSTNGLPLVVERTMRWDKSGYGASGDKAATGPSNIWYFAEGAQGSFWTYVLLANPQTTANSATVTYFREGGTPIVRTYALAPQSRTTVDVGADAALVGWSFGMQVQFAQPGIAERSMYFGTNPLWTGGHESAGVTATATDWLLAEGATGPFFETFILLSNPNATDAQATVTFLQAGGAPVTKLKTVPANGRLTINIEPEDPSLANAAVATQVHSTVPIVAERSQYWPDPYPSWYEAHNSFGVTAAVVKWGLAEGRVGTAAAYQTFILLANPGNTTANVTVQFLRENGGAVVTKTFQVQATSRLNVQVNGAGSDVPELADENFGAIITSDQPIAVERSMYSDAIGQLWAAGTNATATALP
jgi:hypothetical protein